jgi:hypothetical protein
MTQYRGFIPPCGIFCGTCRCFGWPEKPCPGAEVHCKQRRCKGIYVCCIEKKGLRFCYECDTFPCYRFRQFAVTWKKHGQDLIENQRQLKELGEEAWLDMWNSGSATEPCTEGED